MTHVLVMRLFQLFLKPRYLVEMHLRKEISVMVHGQLSSARTTRLTFFVATVFRYTFRMWYEKCLNYLFRYYIIYFKSPNYLIANFI